MRFGRLFSFLVLLWLLIGGFAAYQRDYFHDYFKGGDRSCVTVGNIALTVVAGPLNYAGANPKAKECRIPKVPRPSGSMHGSELGSLMQRELS